MRAPVFSPQNGSYNIGQKITITCPTYRAEIRYTVDGTEPDSLSPLYVSPLVIPTVFINESDYCEIKAKAFKAGLNPSATVTAMYATDFANTVPDPILSPDSGTYNHTVHVSTKYITEDAVYRYTLDGSEPTYNSASGDYIDINQHHVVLKIKGFKTNWNSSNTVTRTYDLPYYIASHLSFPNGISQASIYSNYAYIPNQSGLKIVDMSNPAQPELVNTVTAFSSVCDVAFQGHYAFMAAAASGFRIADISNPVNPVEVAYELFDDGHPDAYSARVNVNGNYAYVTDIEGYTYVVDISNPTDPEVVYCLSTGYSDAISVQGNYFISSDYNSGLRIINISDPTNPIHYNVPMQYEVVTATAVVGNYVYAACRYNGLKVIDISNPASPQIVSTLDYQDVMDIAIKDNRAYLAVRYYGLKMLDISNPPNPIEFGYISTYYGEAFNVTVDDNNAYLANGYYGMDIININNSGKK
jgi:hypothetical protein